MIVYWGVFFFVLGTVWGSFCNVLIARLPSRAPITGRSHCPNCRQTLAWYDLIPLLSFIILRRQCRYCGERISLRYPAVELASGLLFLLIYFQVGLSPASWALYVFYATLSVVIVVVDFEHAIIPNELVIPALPIALFASWANIGPTAPDLTLALWGGVIGGGLFLGLYLLTGGQGMGMGDVKLALFMGLALGAFRLLPAILFASITALVWAGAIMIFFREALGGLENVELSMHQEEEPDITERIWGMMIINGRPAVPFGSFLILGFWFAMLWGTQIVSWWLNLS